MGDYWESGQVFVTGGQRFGLTATCRTICLGQAGDTSFLGSKGANPSTDTGKKDLAIHLDTPKQNVTDNFCVVCGLAVPGKRIDRQYCSPKCRKRASRGKQLELAGVK